MLKIARLKNGWYQNLRISFSLIIWLFWIYKITELIKEDNPIGKKNIKLPSINSRHTINIPIINQTFELSIHNVRNDSTSIGIILFFAFHTQKSL